MRVPDGREVSKSAPRWRVASGKVDIGTIIFDSDFQIFVDVREDCVLRHKLDCDGCKIFGREVVSGKGTLLNAVRQAWSFDFAGEIVETLPLLPYR